MRNTKQFTTEILDPRLSIDGQKCGDEPGPRDATTALWNFSKHEKEYEMIAIKKLGAAFGQGILTALILGFFAAMTTMANSYDSAEVAAVVEVLGNSKHSLAEGARQVAKSGEVAISAKFELDDSKKLSLSVYTAEKGLKEDAEHNVMKEWSGSPEQAAWAPEAEVFKDLEHVSRASEHLTLVSLGKQNLADLISAAEKQHKGTVFSAIPEVSNHRPVLVVLVANKGKVSEARYDLETGHALTVK